MSSFKISLGALKKRKRFISRGESRSLAHELEELLNDLKNEAEDPRAALEELAAFYKADKAIFERCDDSNGYVGDVFRELAPELFSFYAKQCEDKKWIADLIFNLYAADDYGVRFCLVRRMAEFIPETLLRKTVEKFWAQSQKTEKSAYSSDIHNAIAIKSLAVQLKDPALLEQACRGLSPQETS
jgi:hypothetical protein